MTTALTSRTAHSTGNTVLGRLAERWRPAGLFVSAFSGDGAMLWHDPHMPRLFTLAAGTPAMAAALRAANESHDTGAEPGHAPRPPIVPFDCVQVYLTPIARRRKVTGWIAVFARIETITPGEDLQRACGTAALDVQALISQAQHAPLVSASALPTLVALAGQMHEDIQTAATSSGELSSVAAELSSVYEEISTLCKISSGMRFSQKPQAFLETVCQELQAIGNFKAVAIALAQRQDGDASPAVTDVATLVGQCSIAGHELVNALHAPIHNALAAGETRVNNDIARASDAAHLAHAMQRFVCVPLVRDKRPLGVLLAIDKNDSSEFTNVDLTLLNNVGNQCSIFLENASLYQDMQDLFMGVLHALTRSIDAKDAYTRGHSQRVAELSRTLARKAGLTEEQCERVYLSGLLHDIGKIGVPEAVLTKPGRLTDAEFEAIKKHPTIGAQILGNIRQLQDIIPGVLYHHERWDGKGYPYNLAGANIPLMGRIICVADSFDAMSSTRTYRPALPLEVVLKEILRCAGHQFDPALAELFVTLDFEPYKKSIEEHMTFRQLPGGDGLT